MSYRFVLLPLLLLVGCGGLEYHDEITPAITFAPTERLVASWPSCFPPLNEEEVKEPWALELEMGKRFGREFDLFRAITCFKRAEFLKPPFSRQQEIDFSLLFAYYLGCKYPEAIAIFENSSISSVDRSFPAFDTLATVLWECYEKVGEPEKGEVLLSVMTEERQTALRAGKNVRSFNPPEELLSGYCPLAKSPSKARTLQAILPGAGYFYMNQPKSGLTSMLLNGLFIWGTVELFQHGHTGWAIFTLSLETGWYLGGINGAGLLARQHNEYLYNALGKEYMLKERLFPLLQIECAF